MRLGPPEALEVRLLGDHPVQIFVQRVQQHLWIDSLWGWMGKIGLDSLIVIIIDDSERFVNALFIKVLISYMKKF